MKRKGEIVMKYTNLIKENLVGPQTWIGQVINVKNGAILLQDRSEQAWVEVGNHYRYIKEGEALVLQIQKGLTNQATHILKTKNIT